MGKCGAGCFIGIGLAGVVGFIVIDHFVLKDRFGIWLKLNDLFRGATQTKSVRLPSGGTGTAIIQPNTDEYDVAGVKAAAPDKAAAQRQQHLQNLGSINVPAAKYGRILVT